MGAQVARCGAQKEFSLVFYTQVAALHFVFLDPEGLRPVRNNNAHVKMETLLFRREKGTPGLPLGTWVYVIR